MAATVRHGVGLVTSVSRGATSISVIRRGSTLLWQRSELSDYFDGPDSDTLAGPKWAEHGTGEYHLGIDSGSARVKIPEGLFGGYFTLCSSLMRFTVGVAPSDDGYIECVPSSLGSGKSGGSPNGYATDVYRRLYNADFTHGVGIRMMAGRLAIIRRVSGADTEMAQCGSFQPGDVLRLDQANNTHTLYRNGGRVGLWSDSGATASKGSSFRSMGIRADGAKDLAGPRRFSPALDYVVMG